MAVLTPEKKDAYWRKTSTLMWTILVIWFGVSFIVNMFAARLNEITIVGFPLGFYMAAQGSLIVYVVLCFWNANAQNRIDEDFGVAEE
jgi:putative solute:sodium symporter small subunit